MKGTVFCVCRSNMIEAFEGNTQTNMHIDPSANEMIQMDPRATKSFFMRYVNTITENIDVYFAECDIKKATSGFIDEGVYFEHYYVKRSFNCYHIRDRNLFLLHTDTRTGNYFIRSINKKYKRFPTYQLSILDMEFEHVDQRVPVSALSVRPNSDAQIRSHQITGENLVTNPLYQSMKQNDEMRALTIDFIFQNFQYNVLLSKKGSMWIRNSEDNINTNLSIVLKIIEDLFS